MKRRSSKALEDLRRTLAHPGHQSDAALDAIRAALQKPMPVTAAAVKRAQRGAVVRGEGATVKTAPSGRIIGWSRTGQKAGRPAKQHPRAVELRELEDAHLRQQLAGDRAAARILGHPDPIKANAGKASGRSRQQNIEHINSDTDPVAKRVAGKLGVSPRHVRRVRKGTRTPS